MGIMDLEEFRKNGHLLVDWMAEYFATIEKYAVKSKVKPQEIIDQLPLEPPTLPENFKDIFHDFKSIILPGITHWQHPCYFAYFNANNSYPSILGEMLTSALGAQCMIWQTSPAATELEERMMQWTAKIIGLPDSFTGVIQDTASTATLCSILTAREKYSEYSINQRGYLEQKPFTVYCSSEAHSSIEKAVKIAGLGKQNLRKIAVDSSYALIPEELEKTILQDLEQGYRPLAIIAALGTTGSTAVDPLATITKIGKKHNIWIHVDAAYAGTALVLPEYRWMCEGIDEVDTFVFNPHKWMFTNFDCSAYFVKDQEALIRTFEILPEYLKTKESNPVHNYRDWGIQLGRRFRALKLWFVLRSFGIQGIQEKVKNHILWARMIADKMNNLDHFELLAPVHFSTVCFRLHPPHIDDQEVLNCLNEKYLDRLNETGKVFLTHTKLRGDYTIRLVIGQTYSEKKHLLQTWDLIIKLAHTMID